MMVFSWGHAEWMMRMLYDGFLVKIGIFVVAIFDSFVLDYCGKEKIDELCENCFFCKRLD